jgi:hypothetical protein
MQADRFALRTHAHVVSPRHLSDVGGYSVFKFALIAAVATAIGLYSAYPSKPLGHKLSQTQVIQNLKGIEKGEMPTNH